MERRKEGMKEEGGKEEGIKNMELRKEIRMEGGQEGGREEGIKVLREGDRKGEMAAKQGVPALG